jgi:hypothetical protein
MSARAKTSPCSALFLTDFPDDTNREFLETKQGNSFAERGKLASILQIGPCPSPIEKRASLQPPLDRGSIEHQGPSRPHPPLPVGAHKKAASRSSLARLARVPLWLGPSQQPGIAPS